MDSVGVSTPPGQATLPLPAAAGPKVTPELTRQLVSLLCQEAAQAHAALCQAHRLAILAGGTLPRTAETEAAHTALREARDEMMACADVVYAACRRFDGLREAVQAAQR